MTLIPPKRLSDTETQFLVSKIGPSERQTDTDTHAGAARTDPLNPSRLITPTTPTSLKIKYPTIDEFGETGFQSMSWEENEIKAFKRIAWEPGNFKHLTVIYQPGTHVADIE
jgi:hypothetical protein